MHARSMQNKKWEASTYWTQRVNNAVDGSLKLKRDEDLLDTIQADIKEW